MINNSESTELVGVRLSEAARRKLSPMQRRLRIAVAVLLGLNGIAFFLYISPPGGTREDLALESVRVRSQILLARSQATKMQTLASNVQTGSSQVSAFSDQYFLPKRNAYVAVFEEIQRMAKAAGIQERDAGWSEEPIEGTADLTLLNITANYEGTNAALMKFLYESDRSPMLLILDALTAAPQQRNTQIDTLIRFQAIVREAPSGAAGGQP